MLAISSERNLRMQATYWWHLNVRWAELAASDELSFFYSMGAVVVSNYMEKCTQRSLTHPSYYTRH